MTTLQAKLAYKVRKVRSKDSPYFSTSYIIRTKFSRLNYYPVEKRLRVYTIRLRKIKYLLSNFLVLREVLANGKSEGLGGEIF